MGWRDDRRVAEWRREIRRMAINVSIVEDSDRIRESLAALIDGAPGFRCRASYESAEAALRGLPLDKPDVVLMDINLPRMSGIECARALKAKFPTLQIVMLTVFEDAEMVFESLRAGACGYLLKRTPPHKLLEAIDEVHKGGSPMSANIARKVVATFQEQAKKAVETAQLTPREDEILGQLAKGLSYKEIADKLSIGLETVRTHIRSIYEKLQVRSRTEAVVKFLGH
jgi:DNA-binding NarL/FixJ family response regulator